MGKRSFFDNVREWIGNLAFAVLLWSLRKTADEYYDMLELNAAHLPNGAELDTPMPCEHKWLASTTTATGYKCVKCGQWTASP